MSVAKKVTISAYCPSSPEHDDLELLSIEGLHYVVNRAGEFKGIKVDKKVRFTYRCLVCGTVFSLEYTDVLIPKEVLDNIEVFKHLMVKV